MALLANQLCLGGAQLGMKYGLTHSLDPKAIWNPFPTLKLAAKYSLGAIDLAQAYGNSEEVVGSFLKATPLWKPKIITKLDPMYSKRDLDKALRAVERSVNHLGRQIDVLMLHNSDHISDWNYFLKLFTKVSAEGFAKEYGTSTYTPEEFALALNLPELKHIQFPFNVLDTRLLLNGSLDLATTYGIKLYVRSIFLQGLILKQPHEAELVSPKARIAVEYLQGVAKQHKTTVKDIALSFVTSILPSQTYIIGLDNPFQLAEILRIMHCPVKSMELDLTELLEMSSSFVDPRAWEINKKPQELMH
jgi:uncharacterized protein